MRFYIQINLWHSWEKRNTTEGSLTSVVLRKEVMLRILRFVYLGADDGTRIHLSTSEELRITTYTTSAYFYKTDCYWQPALTNLHTTQFKNWRLTGLEPAKPFGCCFHYSCCNCLCVVGRAGIEPTTREFSVLCSTYWANVPCKNLKRKTDISRFRCNWLL